MSTMSAKVLESLNIAYETEVAGYNFYKKASDLTSDSKGKEMFSILAGDELDHIKVIHSIRESVAKGGSWFSYDEAVAIGGECVGVSSIPIFNDESLKALGETPDERKLLEIAIESETEAIRLYCSMLEDAAEDGQRSVLKQLVSMEESHLKLLEWEDEALGRTGFWCDMMEFNVEMEV